MGDDIAGIDIAVLNSLQQWPHVALHMRLPGLECERAVHHRTKRHLVYKPAVDAWDGNDAAVAARKNRFTERHRTVRL